MSDVTMQELQDTIKAAIGYDQVPVSIDGYPEIHWTFRTLKDRDDLVKKISHAVFPLLMAQQAEEQIKVAYVSQSGVSLVGYARPYLWVGIDKDNDDAIALYQPHGGAGWREFDPPDHEWEAPYSAASDLCGAMVMRDGGGDQCGLPKVLHPKKEN